ncbi:MAG: autoinducer 2 ABC transporter ATP-binding protein LsrA [Termitinemataceae bacterium]|nr:MAG: autoinducer 2 ABC transporter ATP-binding protein LsrA [Termitinemataceae bacterium]
MATVPVLSVCDIYKSFGSNKVLNGINLDIFPGEALALIGGNGAGKSTLVKSVMGLYSPNSGQIFVNGEALEFSKPSISLNKGVYLVPQEPMLFPNQSALQNILMGMNGKKSELKEKLDNLIGQLGWNLDLNRSARTLSIAEQQLVEILRGLLREAKLLILDEPTSALTFDEVNSLFKIIESLKQKKIGIVYITHRLNEVFLIATHIAIMRDGTITLRGEVKDFTREMLVKGLLPDEDSKTETKNVAKTFTAGGSGENRTDDRREEGGFRSEGGTPPHKNNNCVFELKNFSGYGFADINLKIYAGEILGLCGVVGAGRTELAMTIFGMDKVKAGQVLLEGADITGMSTRNIIKHGINYVPEDRFLNGIFKTNHLAGNISSACLRSLSKFFLNFDGEKKIASDYVRDFRIKTTGIMQEIGSLSGGNQQKAVISRSLTTLPRLVILDEPTRGIDAGARSDIYSIIAELKERGVSVLLISSDIEEVIELSDRALTMFQGRINGEFSGRQITQDNLMEASFGISKESAA